MHAPIRFLNIEMAPGGDCTQKFGVNKALYAHLGMDGHNGEDYIRPYGEPMFAIEDADVADVKDDPNGYGKHIRIVSKNPDSKGLCNEWTYGHNSANHVKVGDEVKMGQHICDMGNTGFVVSSANAGGFWSMNPYKGTHLHLGLRKVKRVKSGGFVYNASSKIRLSVQNYNNGFYGSIDPRPLLVPLSSNGTRENKKIFQILLLIQSIINSIKK